MTTSHRRCTDPSAAFASACLALVLLGATAAAASPQALIDDPSRPDAFYCEQRKLGTWFYCSRPRPKDDAKPPIPSASPAPAETATQRMEKITAQLRELKARAILEPSPENITAYIRFQREQLDRSSLFSDVWQRAIWQDPDLDYTQLRPVSTLGKRQWLDQRKLDRDAVLNSLKDRYGLFYFFAQGCAPCGIMSPILKSVADSHRIPVMAVSTDGGPSDVFPRYVVDSGQRERMGLDSKVTPAIVLFDSRTRRAIPIGYGVLAADELMDRIFTLVAMEAGRDY